MTKLLTRAEAARHLQISVDQLDDLRRKGGGPEWGQWQGTIRYAVDELDVWLTQPHDDVGINQTGHSDASSR